MSDIRYPGRETLSISDNLKAAGITASTNYLSNLFTNNTFGDSEFGRTFGQVFSSGVQSAGDTMVNNLVKGQTLTEGLGQNVRGSAGGALGGLAASYAGQGVSQLMGNSKLGKFTGGAVSSAGGQVLGSFLGSGAINVGNPYAFGANVLASAFGGMNGPSKEYGGKYGSTTKTMDKIYDYATVAANFIPGAGQFISAGMALNKGLSNLFGSTDGMTKQDAILGSAFMPAPVKWLNMAGAKTTGTFNNQSWQNTERTNDFMQNGFGNLASVFDKARNEAGKTYGTFSRGAYGKANANLMFANSAWQQILDMTRQNEVQDIRSQLMTSINNQKYSQNIQGGWDPLQRGKYGMKILNNATNHNIGMRLLSGAALIDDKQMILCSAVD